MQKFYFVMGLFCVAYPLHSQELADPAQSVITLPTVYSDITPAFETYPEFSSAAVSVISKQQFSANDANVNDVIELTPGIQIQQAGESGAYTSLTVRGAPSQQTQVYIDGILQSNAGSEGSMLQTIPLIDVERIEVYKSSSPGQMAMGSPGGAINIVTKRGRRNSQQLLVELGSYAHKRLSLAFDSAVRSHQFDGYFQAQQSPNDFLYNNDNGTPQYALDDKEERRNNADFASLSAGLGYVKLLDNQNLGLALSYYQDTKHIPDSHNTPTNNAQYAQEKIESIATYNANQWLAQVDSSVRFLAAKTSGEFSDPDGALSTSVYQSRDQLNSYQLNQTSLVTVPFGLVNSATILSYDQFTLDNSLDGVSLSAYRSQLANNLGMEVFFPHDVTLMVNGHNLIELDSHEGNSASRHHIGGNLGLRWGGDSAYLQLNNQLAYRTPTLLERFGNQGVFVGNSDLESETAYSIDLSGTLISTSSRAEVAAYYRNSQKAIAAVYNSQGIGRYINLGAAQFAGIEWTAAWQQQRLTLESSGNLAFSRANSQFKAYDQKRVPGFYPITLHQRVAYKAMSHLQISLGYQYELGLFYDRANSTLAPTKHLLNSELKWSFEHSAFTFSVDNILDREHFDFSRKPQPGRTFTLTYQLNFGDS